jgi:hypothetical protein
MLRLEKRWLRWLLVVPAALGLVAIGYALRGGGSTTPRSSSTQVRTVVRSFAEAADPGACDLLTTDALDRIYGGKQRCIKRAPQFERGAVRITKAIVVEARASVKATSLDGRTLFTVKLEKRPPGCQAGLPGNPWLISSVKEQPNV